MSVTSIITDDRSLPYQYGLPLNVLRRVAEKSPRGPTKISAPPYLLTPPPPFRCQPSPPPLKPPPPHPPRHTQGCRQSRGGDGSSPHPVTASCPRPFGFAVQRSPPGARLAVWGPTRLGVCSRSDFVGSLAATFWTSKKLGSAPASGAAADALVRRRERASASRPLPFLA